MNIPIKPLFIDGLNCIEVLVVSYLHYMQKEINLIFADSWGFAFTPYGSSENEIIFAESIQTRYTSFYTAVEKLFGITAVFNHHMEYDEIINTLKTNLAESKPLGLKIDSYYCNWHDRYMQTHGEHFCLAVGYDDNRIACVDPGFAADGTVWLPCDECQKGATGCFWFVDSGKELCIQYREFFKQAAELLLLLKPFKHIRLCAKAMERYFCYQKECGTILDNPWWNKLFRIFLQISGGRKQFLRFLDDMSGKKLQFSDEHKKTVKVIIDKWEIMRSLLVKYNVGDSFERKGKPKMVSYLYEVADKEEAFIQNLYQAACML